MQKKYIYIFWYTKTCALTTMETPLPNKFLDDQKKKEIKKN